MKRTMTVSDTVMIATDPTTAYAHVSDPTRMGQSSPENLGATVADARDGAYVGMVFDGRNKRGAVRWTTRCEVTAAEPVSALPFGSALSVSVHRGSQDRLPPGSTGSSRLTVELG